jgi:hypothetical protein
MFTDTSYLANVDRKILCIICGNKFSNFKNELYSQRNLAIDFFSNSNLEFDMYGEGWNRRVFKGILRPLNRVRSARNFLYKPPVAYKGVSINKFETLAEYKFSLCYENVKHTNGYISEKIFDSMFSGCVPIYLGADDIEKYIPKNTFINMKNFKSYTELYNYLSNMTKIEYKRYLDAILDYYPKYLNSSFYEFSWANTIKVHCLELLKNKNHE